MNTKESTATPRISGIAPSSRRIRYCATRASGTSNERHVGAVREPPFPECKPVRVTNGRPLIPIVSAGDEGGSRTVPTYLSLLRQVPLLGVPEQPVERARPNPADVVGDHWVLRAPVHEDHRHL